MCEAPRDQGVYLDLLETAIKCLQGGNLHVQTQFLDLLRVSHKALTVMMRQLRAASASLREAATQASAGASGSIALLLGVQVSLDVASQRTDAAGDSIAKAVAGGGSYAATAARRAGDAIPMTTVTKVILRFLQVLCEGHNLEMQNFLRTQGGKAGATNLVAEAVSVLRDIQPHLVAPSSAQVDAVELAIQVRSRPCVATPRGEDRVHACAFAVRVLQALDTVTELVQGPCPDNQMELVTHKFVEVVGSIVESGAGKGTLAGKELQQKCMLAMTSLFEGRRDRDIHHRVASLLNTQVRGHVWRMCSPWGRFT